jgi:hypothetical protein
MKKNSLFLVSGTLLLLLPFAAGAQPYASVKIAYAGADLPLGAPYNGVLDDRSFGLGFDVGLGFGKRWAIEGGAMRYSFDGSGAPCATGSICTLPIRSIDGNDMTIYNASLVPRFTIGDVRLFARIGYYTADIDGNIDLPGADFDEDGIVAGVGIRWYYDRRWTVSLEATRFDDNVRQVAVGFGWGLRLDNDR